MEQPTASTDTQTLIMDLMAKKRSAIQLHGPKLHPGLPLTTTLQSLFVGLRYSTEDTMGGTPEMLMYASRMSFQLLAARCFLAELSSAILLDLALMGNTSSSQVKLNYEIIIDD